MCDAVAFLAQSLSSRVRAFVFACVSAWCVCVCAIVLVRGQLKRCLAKACSGSVAVVFGGSASHPPISAAGAAGSKVGGSWVLSLL